MLYVHVGGSVEVECEEQEEGGATWTRGGREIQNGTHYTIYPRGVLVILNITADITGHSQPYQCANSSSVTIIIIGVCSDGSKCILQDHLPYFQASPHSHPSPALFPG